MTHSEQWYSNYNALKAYILKRAHLPDKKKVQLFNDLLAMHSNEHTSGRKKMNTIDNLYISKK